MPPTLTNGKICYVEIPAIEISRSVEFYKAVFGWNVRRRSDGRPAFDDSVGQVSGTWVTGREPSREPGLLLYIMVDSVAATIDAVTANGGRARTADRCGRSRDHRQVSRPGRKHHRSLSATRQLMEARGMKRSGAPGIALFVIGLVSLRSAARDNVFFSELAQLSW